MITTQALARVRNKPLRMVYKSILHVNISRITIETGLLNFPKDFLDSVIIPNECK